MKKERVILHADLNNFFASVEIALHPEYKGKPLIVCGDPKARHGIVLAKNEEAKKFGIQTAETVYSALLKCPDLLLVPSHFQEYKRYSKLVKDIYLRYTDVVEECSIDECALDMTESTFLFGSGETIAQRIRQEVKEELGVTLSIGVSYNKVFAKLGSELKKPDAVTVISKENYQQIVYPLPVENLLFVGRATKTALHNLGIYTIGDLANADCGLLYKKIGKRGKQLYHFARGEDEEEVKKESEKEDLKSIGNSYTLPKDIWDKEEIKRWFYVLAESVASRLKDAKIGKANTLHIVVRDSDLEFFTWQTKISPTVLCSDIAQGAFQLFCKHWQADKKVRLLGITVSGFDYNVEQLTIGQDGEKENYQKIQRVEEAVSKLRDKYGYASVQRGVVMEDKNASGLDIREKKE